MKSGYFNASPQVSVSDNQVRTITLDYVKTNLKNIRGKHKKIWSIACIVIASFLIEFGIASIFLYSPLTILFLAAGGYMLYRSIVSLKQVKKNIALIDGGAFHFEKAVCSKIDYDPDTCDRMKFEGKSYFFLASSTDKVGQVYYVLFFDKESNPIIIFETSSWSLAPELEPFLKE